MAPKAGPAMGNLVIRPSTTVFRRSLVLAPGAGAAVVAAALHVFRSLLENVVLTVVTLAATAALVASVLLLAMRQSAGVDAGGVWKRTVTGRRRSFPRSAVAGLAVRSIMGRHRDVELVIVHGHDRRALLTFSLAFWSFADLREVARRLTLPMPSEGPARRRRSDLAREFPGSLSFVERHPRAAGFGGALIVLAGIAVAGIVYTIATNG